jgi:hypothetical protein
MRRYQKRKTNVFVIDPKRSSGDFQCLQCSEHLASKFTIVLIQRMNILRTTALRPTDSGQYRLDHLLAQDQFLFHLWRFMAPGLGHRLDGWANRDLDVGAIMALAPDLSALASLLGVDEVTVRKVLNSWGPGKFDAGLLLDGKGFRPDGQSAVKKISFPVAGRTAVL